MRGRFTNRPYVPGSQPEGWLPRPAADKICAMGEVGEIFPRELKARMDRGEHPQIVDVREHEEIALARFPPAIHIPMGDVPSRVSELDPHRETVVICHHGIRSAQVAGYLARMGFARVLNLAGGIDAWSVAADATVPRY